MDSFPSLPVEGDLSPSLPVWAGILLERTIRTKALPVQPRVPQPAFSEFVKFRIHLRVWRIHFFSFIASLWTPFEFHHTQNITNTEPEISKKPVRFPITQNQIVSVPVVEVPYHWECLLGWPYFPFASQIPTACSFFSGSDVVPNAC